MSKHLPLFLDLCTLLGTKDISVRQLQGVWRIRVKNFEREFPDKEYAALLEEITLWISSLKN